MVVNGTAVRVRPWSRWRDAVLCYDADAGLALARGEAWIEDARGEPLDPDGAIVDGAEIRLVAASRDGDVGSDVTGGTEDGLPRE